MRAMKKLFLPLIVFLCIITSGCQIPGISIITKSVKVVNKCCSELKVASCSSNSVLINENDLKQANQLETFFHPANLWDAKMMVW